MVGTTELAPACVDGATAEVAWVVVAPATDEEAAADVATADEVAADDEVATVLVVGSAVVETVTTVVGSEELVLLESAASKPRIWMATRTSIGSCRDARTGSSIAEATMANNHECVAFFIVGRSTSSQ